MKLYTEQQLQEAYYEGWNKGRNYGPINDAEFIQSLTPIELPSDEEIYNASPQHYDGTEYSTGEHHGFMKGAKWMRDKILNK